LAKIGSLALKPVLFKSQFSVLAQRLPVIFFIFMRLERIFNFHKSYTHAHLHTDRKKGTAGEKVRGDDTQMHAT